MSSLIPKFYLDYFKAQSLFTYASSRLESREELINYLA